MPPRKRRTGLPEALTVALLSALASGIRLAAKGFGSGVRASRRTVRRQGPRTAKAVGRAIVWTGRKTGWWPQASMKEMKDRLLEIREELHQYGWGHTTIIDYFDGQRHQMFDVDGVLGQHALDDGYDVSWQFRPHATWHPDADDRANSLRWWSEHHPPAEGNLPSTVVPPRKLHPWLSLDDRLTLRHHEADVAEDVAQIQRERLARERAARQAADRARAATEQARAKAAWDTANPPAQPHDPPHTPSTPVANTGGYAPPHRPTLALLPGGGEGDDMSAPLESLTTPEWSQDNIKEDVPKFYDDLAAALERYAERPCEQIAEMCDRVEMPKFLRDRVHALADEMGEAVSYMRQTAGEAHQYFDNLELPNLNRA